MFTHLPLKFVVKAASLFVGLNSAVRKKTQPLEKGLFTDPETRSGNDAIYGVNADSENLVVAGLCGS